VSSGAIGILLERAGEKVAWIPLATSMSLAEEFARFSSYCLACNAESDWPRIRMSAKGHEFMLHALPVSHPSAPGAAWTLPVGLYGHMQPMEVYTKAVDWLLDVLHFRMAGIMSLRFFDDMYDSELTVNITKDDVFLRESDVMCRWPELQLKMVVAQKRFTVGSDDEIAQLCSESIVLGEGSNEAPVALSQRKVLLLSLLQEELRASQYWRA
jgi:hypothetical protein